MVNGHVMAAKKDISFQAQGRGRPRASAGCRTGPDAARRCRRLALADVAPAPRPHPAVPTDTAVAQLCLRTVWGGLHPAACAVVGDYTGCSRAAGSHARLCARVEHALTLIIQRPRRRSACSQCCLSMHLVPHQSTKALGLISTATGRRPGLHAGRGGREAPLRCPQPAAAHAHHPKPWLASPVFRTAWTSRPSCAQWHARAAHRRGWCRPVQASGRAPSAVLHQLQLASSFQTNTPAPNTRPRCAVGPAGCMRCAVLGCTALRRKVAAQAGGRHRRRVVPPCAPPCHAYQPGFT